MTKFTLRWDQWQLLPFLWLFHSFLWRKLIHISHEILHSASNILINLRQRRMESRECMQHTSSELLINDKEMEMNVFHLLKVQIKDSFEMWNDMSSKISIMQKRTEQNRIQISSQNILYSTKIEFSESKKRRKSNKLFVLGLKL